MTDPLQPLLDRTRAVFPDPIDTALLHDGGDDFRAVEVDGTWIFRIARLESGVAILAVEQRFLRAFAPRSPLPVPENHHAGDEFLGYRKIVGSPLTAELFAAPAPEARNRIALALFEKLFRLASPTTAVHGVLCFADHVFWDAGRQGVWGVIDLGDLTRDDPAQDFLDVLDQGGPAFFERPDENHAGETGERLLERVRLRLQVRPLIDPAYALEQGFIERCGQRLEEIEAAFGA